MDFNQLYYYSEKAVNHLSEDWPAKLLAGGVLAGLKFHVQLLTIFSLLVIVDLASKWLALAYNYIKTPDTSPTVIDALHAIPSAHRAGIISSRAMKTQFACKIFIYMIVTFAAAMVDLAFAVLHTRPVFVTLCVGYLSATELLSIVENLNDAGVSIMGGLLEKIKRVR